MSVVADDLKQQLDIIDIIGRHVDLKRAWSNYTGLCPFHREKSPSFMVSQDKQIFKCFGCGVGGDMITFMMEYEKMDFRDAVKELATRNNFDLTPYQSDSDSSYQDNKDEREKLKRINKLSTQRFVEQLVKDTVATTYLSEQRNISEAISERRQLWYAPNNGQALVAHLQSKWFTIADLTDSWLVKQGQSGDLYSFFRHRIMFPISDHVGNIVGFGGRVVDSEDNPKYLNTTETAIYHKSSILYGLHQAKSAITTHQFVIIVEGYMDVIALDRLWVGVGVAPCGTSLTTEHIKLLRRYTQKLVVLFDNDTAGQTAGLRSIKLMLEQWLYPLMICMPEWYKDIDDVANADIDDTTKQTIVSTHIDWFDGIIAQLQTTYPFDHPVATKQLINEMFGVLTAIGDYSVFVGYMNKLAQLVHIDEHGLMNDYKNRYRSTKQQVKQRTSWVDMVAWYEEDVDLLLHSLKLYNDTTQLLSLLLQDKYRLACDMQQFDVVSTYTQDQLQEWVLRRSRQLDQLWLDKQVSQITQFITRYIQSHLQLIIKSSKLTLDQKQEFLQRAKN